MTGVRLMRRWRCLAALLGGMALLVSVGLAVAQNPNEREVKPQPNAQDKDDIAKADSKVWVLNFRFKDPRLITVEVPGRGRKVCWYLWYQVINYTKEPHTFYPEFELVTHDKVNRPFRDQILPKVQEAIQKVEDPTNFYHIRNSVTMAAEPIPPSKPDAAPIAVTGVAIWDDVDPDSNNYSIFVSGLSNGLSEDDNHVVRRKTLQLNFKRLGDRFYQDSRDIRFIAPPVWTYRATDIKGTKD
jgi:hypothetical protein